MIKAQLNSALVGPDNDEYHRIEAASAVVSEKLQHAVSGHGWKLWWSWGDSNNWRVIIGIPAEEELADLLASDANVAAFAHELVDLIGSAVALNDRFRLHLELDSDERVKANEGWFLRVKGEAQPGRELHFIWNGERLTRA